MQPSIRKLFANCFKHLGVKVLYCDENKKEIRKIRALVKKPDTTYSLGGEGQITNQIAFIEIRRKDINDPQVGDYIRIGEKYYKIFQPPLSDSSGEIFKVEVEWMKSFT